MIEHVDVTNYLAINMLEQMGITAPNQHQIDLIESILQNVVLVRQMTFNNVLSPFERNYLYWIAKGKTDEEIAMMMKTNEAEAEQYAASILDKLNAKTMAQAVYHGMRFGFLEDCRKSSEHQ